MNWHCYNLLYEAKAPIHIGFRTLGIVSRTRYYILGKNFWGAATAMLTRKIMKSYDPGIYEKVGKFVRKNIIFTHFYVHENSLLYPHYENGLRYGELSENEFERQFISSYVSTALEKSYKSAEEKSLHEIEFIKPNYRKGNIETTKFFGHLFINEESESELEGYLEKCLPLVDLNNVEFDEKGVEELFSELWVGGERNYGFGRIKLDENTGCEENDSKKMFGIYRINMGNLRIYVNNSESKILALSHVDFDNNMNKIRSIEGEIEPLVGREWEIRKKVGAGRKISGGKVCLAPGTKFALEKSTEIGMGDFGTWKLI